MARFFIDRPVFAIVIAVVIVLLGIVAIPNLPIAAFPEVVPPVIQITASYLGGNSIDLEKTVAQPIEEQLAGLDGMMYFLSSSANNGSITINVTFQLGTNPDTATVQTQNKVNIALPRLPPEVQRQGVAVKKVSSAFLMVVGLVSPDDRYDSLFLTNYAQINLLNQSGQSSGRRRIAAFVAAGLFDARVGGSGQDGEARFDRHRHQQCDQRAKSPESRRRTGRSTLAARDRFSIRGERTGPLWWIPRNSATSCCERSPTLRCCVFAISAQCSWAHSPIPDSAARTASRRAT